MGAVIPKQPVIQVSNLWYIWYRTYLYRLSYTLRSPYSWRKTATFPVRFDFLTDLFGKLTYVHHLPRSLFPPGRSEISSLSPALSRRPVGFLFQRSN